MGGDSWNLKRRMANCLRILEAEGLIELNYGHLSCRSPDEPGSFLILGHLHERGRLVAEVADDDIVTMNERGEPGPGEAPGPGERYIHLAIYRRRPEVAAVVHCHPRLPTAFGVAGVEILPVDHLGLLFSPSVPIHDYSGQIDSMAKAEAVADTLGGRAAVLLRGHGVAVTGTSPERACLTTLALERTARMQLLAAQIGTPRPIPAEYTEAEGRFSEGLSEQEYFETAWAYYSGKHRRRLLPVGETIRG
jgi:ribulose-5-phosphate 4-epimerase/fuculose-1-phosphate aldolase